MAGIDGTSAQVTQWLIAWSDGRRDALDRLIPVLYKDLRRLAGRYMQHEPAGHPLQATALSTKRMSGSWIRGRSSGAIAPTSSG